MYSIELGRATFFAETDETLLSTHNLGLCSSFLSPAKTLTDPKQQWKLSFIAAFALTTRAYITFVDPDALTDDRLGFAFGIPIVSE